WLRLELWVQRIRTRTSPASRSLDHGPAGVIHARDAGPDGRRDVMQSEIVARRHLGRRDLLIALAADDHDLVANARGGHAGEIDPCVLERRRPDDRRRVTAHEHTSGME